jgi:hypothetical protein
LVARNPKNVVAQNLQAVRTIGGKPPEQCTPEEIIDTFDFMLSLKARYHGGTIPFSAFRGVRCSMACFRVRPMCLNGRRQSMPILRRKRYPLLDRGREAI